MRVASAILFVVLCVFGRPAANARASCSSPVVNALASTVPDDVPIECHRAQSIDAFDNYSWQAFLALVRPAAATRGTPDLTKPVGTTAGSLVFETYKALWEIFTPQGTEPLAWDRTPDSSATPCPNSPTRPGDLVLSSFAKFEDVKQFLDQTEVNGPLVAQNGTAIRYLTAYNRTAFEAIVAKKLYLSDRLGAGPQPNGRPGVEMPAGSIAVKSAWMILTAGDPNRARFRVRKAWVRDLSAPGVCTSKDVALVGLHIMQKTPNSPQWIWSSFEHVDNLTNRRPLDSPGAKAPFVLHDGTTGGMPEANPNGNDLTTLRTFNVVRKNMIALRTRNRNDGYARALSSLPGGVVWQNYRLVMTQWPRPAGQPTIRNDSIPGAFGDGQVRTSFNNPVFETFFQALEDPPNQAFGCLNCHDQARDTSDHLWTPVTHSFHPPGNRRSDRSRTMIQSLGDQLKRLRATKQQPGPIN